MSSQSKVLQDLEPFLQSQIQRLKAVVAVTPTSRGANVTHVLHAVGPRKPDLSQQEQEEATLRPRRL